MKMDNDPRQDAECTFSPRICLVRLAAPVPDNHLPHNSINNSVDPLKLSATQALREFSSHPVCMSGIRFPISAESITNIAATSRLT
jgi:hypothetical protein